MKQEHFEEIVESAKKFPDLDIKRYIHGHFQLLNSKGEVFGQNEAFPIGHAEFIMYAKADILELADEVTKLKKQLQETELQRDNALKLAYIGEHHFPDLTYKARFEELVADFRKLQEEMDAAWNATGSGAKGMVSLEEVVRTKVEEWFAMHDALLDSRAEHERTSSILRNLSEAARARIKQINETL